MGGRHGFPRARAGDPGTALRFEDQIWSYAEYVNACAERFNHLVARYELRAWGE